MRVISGKLKGHKLKATGGNTVRPTADRVKEALFCIIANKLKDARVLDLFAGSGALGIEAISRGARSAVFIDRHPQALKVLRQNLDNCKISDDNTKVLRWNIEKDLNCLNTFVKAFDLVFLDPPYHRYDLINMAIQHLILSNCLADDVTLIAEHEPGTQINLINTALTLTDTRRYGRTQLSFLSHNAT